MKLNLLYIVLLEQKDKMDLSQNKNIVLQKEKELYQNDFKIILIQLFFI